MPPYPIHCYHKGCPNLAIYKIAARWSDGFTQELKTYALCCPACLAEWFSRSVKKQQECRLAPGETLETPGVYRMERGSRDRALVRLPELEEQLKQGRPAST